MKELIKLKSKIGSKIGRINLKKIFIVIAIAILFWFVNRFFWLFRIYNNSIFQALMNFESSLQFPLPSLHFKDFSFSVLLTAIIIYQLDKRNKNKNNFKEREEYGSAKWGEEKDIIPFMDQDNLDNNVILTQSEGLKMNGRPSSFKYDRNKNVLVVGGSGSGKTRFFVKPNLMQKHSSYVITDPKGDILTECGYMLSRKDPKIGSNGEILEDEKGNPINEGYKIKVFNTKDFSSSMHYNPLAYIKNEVDVIKFVNVLIANTKGEGDRQGEDFWIKAERLFLMAIVGLVCLENNDPEFINMSTVLDLFALASASEEDENAVNELDNIINKLEEGSFAKKMYANYKKSAGKTAKSILISVAARLAVFDIKEVREVMEYDELELNKLGGYWETLKINSRDLKVGDILLKEDGEDKDIYITEENIKEHLKKAITENKTEKSDKEINNCVVKRVNTQKTALFIIIDDSDTTFNFLVAILYTQMFNFLINIADNEFSGKLPVPVRCLLDEFANIGLIPNFEKLIATIRSRQISASIILQTKSQLKGIYKDHSDTIIGNCDSQIFLGGMEETTLKSMSDTLGKETIDIMNKSLNYSQYRTHGQNYQRLGRELMTKDELAVMEGTKCILQLRGVRPFLSNKYDITKHKRYKYLDEADERYVFNTKKYIEKLKVTRDKKSSLKKQIKDNKLLKEYKRINIEIEGKQEEREKQEYI